MLSIAKLAPGSQNYYLSLAREDYYSEMQNAPGSWMGKGAETLGLSGIVNSEILSSLFRGYDPSGSYSLIQEKGLEGRKHCPGWDLTFSAPKSVSVLWSQADQSLREKIEEAHKCAVAVSMEYLEANWAYTRRGKAGRFKEKTTLIGARFDHGTSRSNDPQLHSHVLVLNLCTRNDGTTGTIFPRDLYRAKMAAGALFRLELSTRLESLGIRTERAKDSFEVTGIPKSLISEFSKRRQAIESELRNVGISSAVAASVAALTTRQKKSNQFSKDLFQKWKITGKEHGWNEAKTKGLFTGHARAITEKEVIRGALAKSVERLTEKSAHFSELEFLQVAAQQLQSSGLGASFVVKASREFLENSKDVVRLGMYREQSQFTSKSVLQREKTMVLQLEAIGKKSAFAIPASRLAADLSSEQTNAVRHITEGRDLSIIIGLAGTGKTRLLFEANQIWKSNGYKALGFTVAAKAAKELQNGSNIASSTIAKLLFDVDRGQVSLDSRTVLVLDEAGMIATPELSRIAELSTEYGCKLVLVGDHRQLQAIGPGAPLRYLAQKFGCASLSAIQRQQDRWAAKAVQDFSSGNAIDALKEYANRGLVTISQSKAESQRCLIEAWSQSSVRVEDRLILAATRSDVHALNRLAQEKRLASGEIKSDQSALIGQDRFYVLDRILFTKNRRPLGIANGDIGTIESISSDGERLKVRIDGQGPVTILAHEFDGESSLGYAITTHKAQGATTKEAFLHIGGSMQDRELSYVQSSRARNKTQFFATKLQVGDEIANLALQMSRSNQKELAISIQERSKSLDR
ncbi:MAG: relaxase domain-containing protein [Armatimonadetes bacterium]|nr:relaxase domain-containing protein [Armatimonadota bacterium]